METKLSSYQEKGIRLQLIEITKEINVSYPIKIKEICGGWLIKWSNGKNESTTYQNAKSTINLYKMNWDNDKNEYINATKLKTKTYQIRKNRKILCNLKWESPARQKFLRLIQDELLQTSINYEEEQ